MGSPDPRHPRERELATFDRNIAAKPEEIVELIEKAIEKGQSISFPGPMAKGLYGMRRLSPSLLWKVILREERA